MQMIEERIMIFSGRFTIILHPNPGRGSANFLGLHIGFVYRFDIINRNLWLWVAEAYYRRRYQILGFRWCQAFQPALF
jgi:hypothetical protein